MGCLFRLLVVNIAPSNRYNMFIQNVSMSDVVNGNHYHEKNNTVLIQIQDYDFVNFAKPSKDFVKTYQFNFDDNDTPSLKSNITDNQAKEISAILVYCYQRDINLVVHCHTGIRRSGAVAEAGIVMGFEDRSKHRIPNVLVKTKLFKELGYTSSLNNFLIQ